MSEQRRLQQITTGVDKMLQRGIHHFQINFYQLETIYILVYEIQ